MAETDQNTKGWRELRRQIPWRPEHYDKSLLGAERPNDSDGKPVSDKVFHGSVADPVPEVVFYRETADGAGETKAVPIPKAEYDRVVKALQAGVVTDDPANNPGVQDLGRLPLSELFPSLAKYETDPPRSILDSLPKGA